MWRNLVTEEKSKQAETLADYRGNYKYNLLDDNLRAFNAAVPTLALWDNHEVMGKLVAGSIFAGQTRGENNTLAFAARARRAFHEYLPMRETMAELGRSIAKSPTGRCSISSCWICAVTAGRMRHPPIATTDPTIYLLGPAQLAWLKRELTRSRATWKIIAADSPIGYVIASGVDADGAHGRGLEIADLLSFIKRAGIRDIAWITADLHYTAAHYYDPNRAAFQDFLPFWEFVSGPLHAGTWTPVALDRTFGPQVVFHKAPTARARRQFRALLWAAILRPHGHQWRHRLPHRHAQRCGRSGALVDPTRSGTASPRRK